MLAVVAGPPRAVVWVQLVGFLLMKVSEKGQITIPKDIRDALGIDAGSEVTVEVGSDGVAVLHKTAGGPTRGEWLAHRLRGRGDVRMTTDEIMALTRLD